MRYLIIVLLFVGCKRNPDPISTQTLLLDTIATRPSMINARPLLFESAFIKGATRKVKDKDLYFYGVNIGNIKVPSGIIIACDPLHIEEYGIPFIQQFPKGEFPVQLSVVNVESMETIVFARIKFSDEPVHKWAFALQKGQEPMPLGKEKIHGYSVDGGVGIFMDTAAIRALDNKTVENFEGDMFRRMNRHNGWKYLIYNFGDHNLAAFSSGFGDGKYATYIGFDASGNPCRLLTDFGIIEWKLN